MRIAIVGAGKGGTSLLEILSEDPLIKITGVADRKKTAPGIRLATALRIPTTADFKTLLKKKNDIIINVTGSPKVEAALQASKRDGIEILSGRSAKLAWTLIDERQKSQREAERLLSEYLSLYDLSLKLSSNENIAKLYATVIDYATELTRTPAGSLAMFDEERGEMVLVASKGFSRDFSRVRRWRVRKGGLTTYILNQKGVVAIESVKKFPKFNNPVLLEEKVEAVAAIPLWNEGKILGILYVNDFKPHLFSEKEISLLSLVSTIAATSIGKAKILEMTRLMAITDELTGLFNHRHLLQQLSSELSRTQRYGRALTLAMLDIDHFKQYNDTHGHLMGNEVLRTLGDLIRRNIRETDIAARYGGEEFSIIMPETNRTRGKIIAERLRKAIADYPFKNGKTQPGGALNVSIGLATYPENAASPHDLIEAADRALYRAKSTGRNRVCLSTKQEGQGSGAGGRGKTK
ncbi:MAG: diguanylate cyclase [Candidatus Manganitrophus sp.]|nr:diguanylate cyclase [Candidatus Manganitrophus sp.]WDT72996.1 MAG: diguanylate cyclase [Candidatus Manganitrophus sp.]